MVLSLLCLVSSRLNMLQGIALTRTHIDTTHRTEGYFNNEEIMKNMKLEGVGVGAFRRVVGI